MKIEKALWLLSTRIYWRRLEPRGIMKDWKSFDLQYSFYVVSSGRDIWKKFLKWVVIKGGFFPNGCKDHQAIIEWKVSDFASMLLQATEIVFTSFTETIVVAFDVAMITPLFWHYWICLLLKNHLQTQFNCKCIRVISAEFLSHFVPLFMIPGKQASSTWCVHFPCARLCFCSAGWKLPAALI